MATQVVNLDNFVESDEEVDDALASSVATLTHTNGSSWALHAGETVIGRAEAADICMPDLSSLSSKHIRFGINAETQVCAVTDLGSTNGSQVAFPDGKTVKRICLPLHPLQLLPTCRDCCETPSTHTRGSNGRITYHFGSRGV